MWNMDKKKHKGATTDHGGDHRELGLTNQRMYLDFTFMYSDSYYLIFWSLLFNVAGTKCITVNYEFNSSTNVGKTGVQIGRDFVFYNPYIQKVARAQRHQKLCLKRGKFCMYSPLRIFLNPNCVELHICGVEIKSVCLIFKNVKRVCCCSWQDRRTTKW